MEESILVQNTLNIVEDLKAHLEDVAKKKAESTANRWDYGYNYRCGGNYGSGGWESDYRTVYFYEYSNVNNRPKVFSKVSEFVKWCEECKIFISDYTKRQLRSNNLSYVCCYIHSATLIVRHTYQELKAVVEAQKEYTDYYARQYPEDDYDYWD